MVGIRHVKVATLPDEVGAEVNKAEWNDTHAIDANTIGDAEIATFTTTKITVPTTLLSGTITDAQLAGSIDATKIADGSVTSAEFQFINTLSSNAQTQIDSKEPLLPTMVGQSLKFLRVNVGETDQEWATVTGGSGTDEVLLITAADKTIPINTSIVVGDYYEIGNGFVLDILEGANLTVV